MAKRLFIIPLLSIVLVATGCGKKLQPQESCNFVQNSQMQRVSWKNHTPIEMYIHESVPAQYRPAITRAMAHWEYVLGRSLFRDAGVASGPVEPKKDGRSVIYLLNKWDSARREEQARTTIFWAGDQIQEADIRINGESHQFSVLDMGSSAAVDMESLMVHELGHVLGLQHIEPEKPDTSVMAVYLSNGEMRRDPQPIDVGSLRCEY